MAMAGLYRRILPSPPAIDFASAQGKELFLEGIQRGTMESFYKLISYFQTQSEPAYCGLASLSMVLNALAIDPGRKWKGPWRWFDESMLDCCEPLDKVKATGISFSKLVCLAQCAGAKVEAFRADQSNIEEFRRYVMKCSTSEDSHVISSYHRETFKQTGTGHFSPIGGYHAEKDMALILDVARFKYPPHWVPLPLLWEAMDNVDEASGQRRGFMVVSRPQREPGLLYTLSCKHESWISIAKYLVDDVPILLRSEGVKDLHQIILVVFSSLPSNFDEFIKWVAEVRRPEDGHGLSEEEKGRVAIKEEVLRQVQQTCLFRHVQEFLISASRNPKAQNYNTKESLPDLAASVCCQAAEFYAGISCSPGDYCYKATCVRCMKANDDKPVTVVSGTVTYGASEQGLDVLVPSSQPKPSCCGSNPCTCTGPAASDVLTVLLLSLPPRTWSGIKDEKLLHEMHNLVSIDNLPPLLQEEVMHLRQQLQILNECQENKGFIHKPTSVYAASSSYPSTASASLRCLTQETRGISRRLKCNAAELKVLGRSCHSWKQ